VAVVIHQEIEKPRQFRGGWDRLVRLLRTGEKVQAVLACGHQAIEQRNVETMQVLERIGYSEAGAQIEVELGVADRSEVHEDDVAISFLQSHRRVDGCGGGAGATFCAEKGKDASLPGRAASAGAVGAVTG